MITAEIIVLAKKIWDYHHMNHTLEKADCIMVLGSHDTRVAERGAELYLQGWAPVLLFSGGVGRLTEGVFEKPEAELFAQIALEKGVPEEAVLVENKSTNTGENILYTQRLLQEKNIPADSFIVVQKPYMERRSYATFKKHWPDKRVTVTSPQIPFDEYPTDEIPLEKVINIMVGDLQRIKIYPEKGFQIEQDIPDDIWQAYEQLVNNGFDQHLVC